MNLSSRLEKHFPAQLWSIVKEAARIADKKKQRAVLVGGVVRDVLLDRPVLDADVMLEPPAEPLVKELAKLKEATVVSHDRFLTFTLHLPSGDKMDVVTAREERYAAPAKLPDVRPSDIHSDLKRRDFTINAIAASLNEKDFGELVDPFNGTKDLTEKTVRALHAQSFMDDPTRIYRAARFAARFGFRVEHVTAKWIQDSVEKKWPALLSPVRRRHEFEMILKEENPLGAIDFLEKWQALAFLHPEWRISPEHRAALSTRASEPYGAERLLRRWKDWLRPWGKPVAEKMMGELAFERETRKRVSAEL